MHVIFVREDVSIQSSLESRESWSEYEDEKEGGVDDNYAEAKLALKRRPSWFFAGNALRRLQKVR